MELISQGGTTETTQKSLFSFGVDKIIVQKL